MSFGDISARMKQVRASKDKDEGRDESRPYDYAESYRIRAKMIGVLLRDARVNSARTIEDCARLLRVSSQEVEAWEYGDLVPSLPQIELLAYYFDVPISHFWGQNTLQSEREVAPDAQGEYMALRNRMIGALLRQAREEAGISLEDLSAQTNIALENLMHYEFGQMIIPMHELTVLANLVNKRMNYFLETSSHIGELLRIREEWQQFAGLDEEIRQFAANPLNIGFIKIAMMFSKMPVEELRLVAEGMLEITH